MRLVLASASPARLATLRAAGIEPEVVVSGVDETGIHTTDPVELVSRLAELKATAVAARVDERFVLGCDSMLALGGDIVGKPSGADEARSRWRAMRGRSGVLHTGHCLIDREAGVTVVRPVATVVHFATVSDAEIDAYVGTGEPLAVAGGFTLDGLGGAFVTGIEGDHHNVVGLSLPALREMLADLGIRWTDLWTASDTAD